ncbi:hypothetical protein GCM10010911_00930 [Paenibacillus nasutitermitis]|uniref:HTH araC/xylS-type domain-containing protein n=2 Tax=Paenibacillus nasutitermitis TaxID=1652958 RepID=A0A916YJ59_9BACL|nr:hypothetical protein GCM10010911_00930 [Paenibacillus nasutitermitis]
MAAFSYARPGMKVERLPEFYRLWYIKEGEGLLSTGDQQYELRAGQIYLLPPGAELSLNPAAQPAVGLYWCHFHATRGDTQLFELLRLPFCVESVHRERIIASFESLIHAFHSSSLSSDLRVRAGMLEIIAFYLDYCELQDEILRRVDSLQIIHRVLEYIDGHLAGNIGVEELAKLAYLHPNYFISFFKNAVGFSPIQYVNKRRMEEARKLLEQTDRAVNEVAGQVGLQNHYLSRLFKQYMGLSPSHYRRIYRSSHHLLEEGDQ